jgi:hypothetical protein
MGNQFLKPLGVLALMVHGPHVQDRAEVAQIACTGAQVLFVVRVPAGRRQQQEGKTEGCQDSREMTHGGDLLGGMDEPSAGVRRLLL